ncbi:hypothetical protein NQ314_001411 [Rhamnusium bicolor]|uniref:DDE-1 domain-containing protein n=1 Tax=Rhamnusium bicolor TaxID=1586634 RepID=A0AAV8ZVD9_9CUCU|nr:hypothetical protein NQ314_001411 [Rhamnusium bicolor]
MWDSYWRQLNITFSDAVLNKCQEMSIAFICLPSNATHVMQPLDVSFYAPLKKILEGDPHSLEKTKGRKMSCLSKDVFPQLLNELQKKLDDNGKGSQNLISGFAKTGLYPFNPSRPKQRLPSDETDDHTPSLVSHSIIHILKEMRVVILIPLKARSLGEKD